MGMGTDGSEELGSLRPVDGSTGEHAVQFYRSDALLCESAGQYLAAGLACGARLVIIATEPHRRALREYLRRNMFDVDRASAEGRIAFADAADLLARIMVGASPDARAFEEVIGPFLDPAGSNETAGGAVPLRAYGEMVDLLWSDGNHQGALGLEALWNEAREKRRFSLLCAYRMDSDGPERRTEVAEVHAAHTHAIGGDARAPLEIAADRAREVGFLEKRARALEHEIRHRAKLEEALREALADHERILVKVESDRARLERSEERQAVQRRRVELLQAVTAAFARALDPIAIAALIVHEGTAALGATSGGLWLVARDGRSLRLVRSTGLSPELEQHCTRLPLDSNLPVARCHALRSEVCFESKAAYLEVFPDSASPILSPPDFAILCLPLTVEQRCFGAFCVAFEYARTFSADERGFLTTLAYHAAQALERARLFEEAERVGASLRFLCEASGVLAGSLDYDATFARVVSLAVPRVAEGAWIDMAGSDGAFRRAAVAHADGRKAEGIREAFRRRAPKLDDATGPGSVVRTGKADVALDGDAALYAADPGALALLRDLGFTSSMCVPLRVGQRPGGAMTFVSSDPERRFDDADLALAEELARRAGMAIDNARAYREAREANRVKDDFLATMSHELRTPLNAILGWAGMLRTRPDVNVAKAIATIERNARAQVRLIEEILDVSRIMTGKLKLDPKSIDLAVVLRASVDVVAPSAMAKSIAIESDVQIDPCPFYGDAGRLQQVVWNLLSNAIKFTPKGGHVDVRLSRSGSDLELSVKDTGRGVRSDFLPVMFQRFRQADSSTTRSEGGLGIGLAIVGHIVELHGGVVKAASAGEGRGTTFTITLPIRAIRLEAPAAGSSAAAPSTEVRRALAGLRILICEDDADSRELLQAVLAGQGARVVVAAAASEAIEHLREFRPDVLVSDIGLPLVDGYALMRQVRCLSADEGGCTPAIALTAYAGSEDVRKALSAGYQLHVAKPVDPTELATRVANLAGRPADGGPPRLDRGSGPRAV
jgi:signal transduction histidine kinase/ActR/RegA family two-component response regulator